LKIPTVELSSFLKTCVERVKVLPAGEVPLGDAVGCAAGASGLVPAGELVSVATAMELTSRGLTSLRVHPRPRVLVVAVGDEIDASERAKLLAALLELSGVRVTSLAGMAEESDDALEMLEHQLDSIDFVVLSASEESEIFLALAQLVDLSVAQLKSEPGGVCAFAELRSPGGRAIPLVVLPTDWRSMSVLTEVLVSPMIRRRSGDHQIYQPIVRASLTAAVTPKMRGSSRDRAFIPGRLHEKKGVWCVEPLATLHAPPIKGLSDSVFATSNCLIVVPAGTKELERDDVVGVMRLDGRRTGGS
jgi:molybdopterin molybdotransferase